MKIDKPLYDEARAARACFSPCVVDSDLSAERSAKECADASDWWNLTGIISAYVRGDDVPDWRVAEAWRAIGERLLPAGDAP